MKDFEHLTELPGTPQEQAWIRERLETLSVQEGIVLAAVTEEKPPVTAADVVNQFFELSGHVVVRAASDHKQLGKFFAETIMLAPEHVREYMDYEKLGQMYAQKHPGRFSEGHYVFLPDCEGPFRYNPETGIVPQDTDWSVKLKLATSAVPEGVWLRFPDYENEFESRIDEVSLALDVLEVQKVQECTLLEARCSVPQAGNLMEQYTDIADLIYDGNEFGFLLRQQSDDNPHFMECLTAAMEYEHCDNLESAMFIAKNIGCYEWIPTGEVQKIAEKSLIDTGISEEIVQSGAIDLQAYGTDILENCGFRLTSDGSAYIGRNSQDFVYEQSKSAAPEMSL